MNSNETSPPTADRLRAVVHQFLEATRAGQVPDREELLRQHPDLAERLRSFFQQYDQVGPETVDVLRPPTPETPPPGHDGATEAAPVPRQIGDYELLGEIARGGMGVVSRARQRSLNRIVALKTIRPGQFADAEDVQRFRAEAEAAAKLDHPNIVPVYEVGEHQGQPFFSMKLVEGGHLGQHAAHFAADPTALARTLILVARAVHHAHQRGILHRDLKPSNILLDAQGQPLVTDFGLAKKIEAGEGVTISGAVVGTPEYMAPEQAIAQKVVTTAVDVHGLGTVLYAVLTGRAPFGGANLLETLEQVVVRDPTPPRAINSAVPRDLDIITLKCLHKDPSKRYSSAEALADELERWLNNEPIQARPAGRGERLLKWARRRPAAAALFGATAVAAVMLIGVIAVFSAFLLRSNQDLEAKGAELTDSNQTLTTTVADLKKTQNQLIDQRNKAIEAQKQAKTQEKKAKTQEKKALEAAEVAKQKALVAFRGQYAAKLSQVALLTERQPQQALAELNDPQTFPPDLRDFTWGLIRAACTRDLYTVRAGPSRAGKAGGDEAVFFGPTLLVTLAPLSLAESPRRLGGQRVRRFDAVTGELLGELLIEGRVTFSKDRRFAAQFADSVLRRWDLARGQAAGKWTLHGIGDHLTLWTFSDNLNALATLTDNGKVSLWDATSGRPRRQFDVPAERTTNLALTPAGDRVLLFERDPDDPSRRLVSVWESNTSRPPVRLEGSVPGVEKLALSPDGRRLAVSGGSHPGGITVHDLDSGKSIPLPDAKTYQTDLLAFGPRGQTLLQFNHEQSRLAGDPYFTLHVWDLAGPKGRLLSQVGIVKARALLAPDHSRIVLTWVDGLWMVDAVTGQRVLPVDSPVEKLKPVALSPDGQLLVTEGGQVWTLPSGRQVISVRGGGPVAFTADGKRLATGTGPGQLTVWNIEPEAPFTRLLPWNTQVQGLSLTPDGSAVAVVGGEMAGFPASRHSEAKLLDTVTGRTRATFSVGDRAQQAGFLMGGPGASQGLMGTVAVAPDGATFAMDRGWELLLWNRDGSARRRVEIPNGFAHIVFTPDGREVALSGNSAVLFRKRSGEPAGAVSAPGPLSSAPALSGDGRLVAAGGRDGSVWVWERASGRRRTAPYRHKGVVRGVALAPEGDRVASGGGDGIVRLWDLRDGSKLALTGHGQPVNAVAFCGGGRTLCSGGSDGSVRFWDPLTGQLRGTFHRHSFPVTTLAVSADGQTLASGSEGKKRGGEVLIWRSMGAPADPRRSPGGTFTDPQGIVHAAFGTDGKTVVTLSRQGRARRWDLATGTPVEPPRAPEFDFRSGRPFPTSVLSLGVDDRNRVSFAYERQERQGQQFGMALFRWDEEEGEKRLFALPPAALAARVLRKTALAPAAGVAVAAYSPPPAPVPTKFLLCMLDLKSGKESTVLEGGQPFWLGQSPNGRWAALLQTEGSAPALRRSVVVLDLQRKAIAWRKPVPPGKAPLAHFTSDSRVVHLDSLGTFAADSGQETEAPAATKAAGNIVSPDGRLAVTFPPAVRGQSPGVLSVVEVGSAQVLGTVRLAHGLHQAVFSSDSKFLFVLDASFQYEELLVWDVQARRDKARFAGRSTGMIIERKNLSRLRRSTEFLFPVGDTLLAVVRGGEVRAWDWANGVRQDNVKLSPVEEKGLHLSPDGKTLLLRARDGTWQFWDTATWKPRKVVATRASGARSALVSKDGKTLTLVDAVAVRRWDLEKMTETGVFPLRTGASPHYLTLQPFMGPGGTSVLVPRVIQAKTPMGEEIFVNKGGKWAVRFRHDDAVEALALDAGGALAASVGSDRVIHVWETASGRERCALRGHEGAIHLLAFAPGKEMLLSAGDDGTVRLWDLTTGKEKGRLRGHEGAIRAVAFSPDRRLLAAGGEDMVVRVWEVASSRLRAAFRDHEAAVVDVAFARDGKRLVAVAGHGTVRVWDIKDLNKDQREDGGYWERPVVLAADGKTLFIGRKDGALEMIDLVTKARRQLAARHSGPVTALALSPDGKVLASGGSDGQVRLGDPAGKETDRWEGPGGPVTALAFSPDGLRLACGEGRPPSLFLPPRPARIALRDLKSGSVTRLVGHRDGIRALAFSPDGKRLASASDDTTARLWDASGGGELRTLLHAGPVLAVAFAADGRLLTGTLDPTIHWADQFGANVWTNPLNIWDGLTGNWLGMLPTSSDLVRGLNVSADGAVLAVAELDGAVSVWDLRNNRGEFLLRAHTGPVERVLLARDGRMLVTTGADGKVRVWDVPAQGGREVLADPAAGTFAGLALTAKGDLVAVVEEGRVGARLRLLETAGGKERASVALDPRPLPPGWPGGEVLSRISIHMAGMQYLLPRPLDMRLDDRLHPFEPVGVSVERPALPLLGPHPGRFVLAVTPDGRWAATAPRVPFNPAAARDTRPPAAPPPPANTDIRLWDLKEGKSGAVLKGHKGHVTALTFSADGKVLASAGDDGARLWDVGEGKLRRLLTGHTGAVRCVQFSADGAWLATGDEGQAVRLWHTATGKEAAVLRLGAAAPPVGLPPRGGRPAAEGQAERPSATAAFAPDGKTLATSHSPFGAGRQARGYAQVIVWQLGVPDAEGRLTPKGPRVLTNLPYPAALAGFDGRGEKLFVAAGHLVFAYDVASGRRLGQWSTRQGVAGSPGLLASLLNVEEQGCWAAFVARVEVRSGTIKRRTFTGLMAGRPTTAAASADGDTVLAFERPRGFGDLPSPLFVWNTGTMPPGTTPATAKPIRTLPGKEFMDLRHVALSPDGKIAALVNRRGQIVLLETVSGKRLHTLTSPVSALVFSPDGALLAGAENGDRGMVHLWEVSSGKEKGRFEAASKSVRALVFAADGRNLAVGTVDGTLSVWSVPDLRRLGGVKKAHAVAVSALAFDGGGKLLASGSPDGSVVVWETATGQAKLRLRQYRSAVHALALSKDGKLLAAGVEAGVQVVDAASGAPLRTMPLGRVTSVRFLGEEGKEFQFLLTQTTPNNWRGTVRVTNTATAGRPRMEVPLD